MRCKELDDVKDSSNKRKPLLGSLAAVSPYVLSKASVACFKGFVSLTEFQFMKFYTYLFILLLILFIYFFSAF